VFYENRVSIVSEAGCKLAHDPGALLDFAQQQSATIGGDGPAIKPGSNLAMF
jgi:hypothetical protein